MTHVYIILNGNFGPQSGVRRQELSHVIVIPPLHWLKNSAVSERSGPGGPEGPPLRERFKGTN